MLFLKPTKHLTHGDKSNAKKGTSVHFLLKIENVNLYLLTFISTMYLVEIKRLQFLTFAVISLVSNIH